MYFLFKEIIENILNNETFAENYQEETTTTSTSSTTTTTTTRSTSTRMSARLVPNNKQQNFVPNIIPTLANRKPMPVPGLIAFKPKNKIALDLPKQLILDSTRPRLKPNSVEQSQKKFNLNLAGKQISLSKAEYIKLINLMMLETKKMNRNRAPQTPINNQKRSRNYY